MKFPATLASAIALAALAVPAHAQIDPSRFGLEIQPVFRRYTDNGDGTFTATDNGTSLFVNALLGPARVRLELRYRITVSGSTTGSYVDGGTTYSSGGLASTSVNIRLNEALNPGATIAPAPIGLNAGNTGTGYANPDVSVDPGSGFGLYAPWRTGSIPAGPTFGGNNGTVASPILIQNILPLATGAPDQRSGTTAAAAARSWSFYALDITIPQTYESATGFQVITFTVQRGDANGTPAPFLFFPRVGTANQSSAITGTGPFTTGPSATLTIQSSIFPAPGAGATVALGAALATRRRRR